MELPQLPADNILAILEDLNYYDMVSVCRTVKELSQLCKTNEVRRLFKRKLEEEIDRIIFFFKEYQEESLTIYGVDYSESFDINLSITYTYSSALNKYYFMVEEQVRIFYIFDLFDMFSYEQGKPFGSPNCSTQYELTEAHMRVLLRDLIVNKNINFEKIIKEELKDKAEEEARMAEEEEELEED